MADPIKYKPHFNYSGWEAAGNKRPKPGAELDIDFANIARSVDETIDALKDIRRSDGKLVNGIVDKDALDASSVELWESAEIAAGKADQSAQAAAGSASAAAASAELARGFASDIVSQGNVPIYSTAQGVAGLKIPAGITAFRTNGAAAPGDGGDALWVEGTSSDPGAVQDADGNWWRIAEKVVRPQMFGAKGDGSTDDQLAIEATINFALLTGSDVYWTDDDFLTTGSIPGFHSVRHQGPGRVLRGSSVWYIAPKEAQVNQLHVSPTGNDADDGLSPDQPMRQIRHATTLLETWRSAVEAGGSWRIKAAPGKYAGGIVIPAGLNAKEHIRVLGYTPGIAVGAVVDMALDREGASGSFSDGEAVTGGTSGATAVVQSIKTAALGPRTGEQIALVAEITSGSFLPEEVLTGGTSGATATLNAVRDIPTVLIDHDEDPSADRAFLATDNLKVWLQDVKIIGGFAIGDNVARNAIYQRVNVHVDGPRTGFYTNNRSVHNTSGGIIENCENIGANELFSVVRSYARTDDPGKETLIRNCSIGLNAKENCSGHLDDIRIEDCHNGIIFHAWSAANMRRVKLRRNDVAGVLVNSEWHNESSIRFGEGADRNLVTVLPFGNSSEINEFGWSSADEGVDLRAGYRPAILLAGTYTPVTHTGTTSETQIYAASGVLKGGRYAAKGRKFKVVIYGFRSGNAGGDVTVLVRSGALLCSLVIPPTSPGQPFRAEVDVISTGDGNAPLYVSGVIVGDDIRDVQNVERALDISAPSDRGLTVACTLSDAADTCRFDVIEVWG